MLGCGPGDTPPDAGPVVSSCSQAASAPLGSSCDFAESEVCFTCAEGSGPGCREGMLVMVYAACDAGIDAP
jgi:hypothetical protein